MVSCLRLFRAFYEKFPTFASNDGKLFVKAIFLRQFLNKPFLNVAFADTGLIETESSQVKKYIASNTTRAKAP